MYRQVILIDRRSALAVAETPLLALLRPYRIRVSRTFTYSSFILQWRSILNVRTALYASRVNVVDGSAGHDRILVEAPSSGRSALKSLVA